MIMKKKILYPNCSELLADFCIHDPQEFFKMISAMGLAHGWMFDPPLSLKILEDMVKAAKEHREERPEITVVDSKGRTTSLEYGSNGYDDSLGFRLDSGCNHYDSSQYQFFEDAIEDWNAEIKAYDGGSTEEFEKWQQRHDK